MTAIPSMDVVQRPYFSLEDRVLIYDIEGLEQLGYRWLLNNVVYVRGPSVDRSPVRFRVAGNNVPDQILAYTYESIFYFVVSAEDYNTSVYLAQPVVRPYWAVVVPDHQEVWVRRVVRHRILIVRRGGVNVGVARQEGGITVIDHYRRSFFELLLL